MGISGVSLDKESIISAIVKNKGVIAHAAASINCNPDTIFLWARRDEDVKNAIKNAREARIDERSDKKEIILDKAYTSIIANLDKFDVTTTIFALKTLDKWLDGGEKGNTFVIETIEKPYDVKKIESDIKH